MIYWYDTLESTNSYAREHLDCFDNLSVIAAKCQTKGRGQGDHSWTSEPGKNMTLTVVLRACVDFELEAKDAIIITHITTCAIRNFLSTFGIKTRIKWPNDIYVGEKKICGILIENILKGHYIQNSMIGIGINLNQSSFSKDLPNPISVKQLTGTEINLEEAVKKMEECFTSVFFKALTPQGRETLKQEFDKNVFFVR